MDEICVSTENIPENCIYNNWMVPQDTKRLAVAISKFLIKFHKDRNIDIEELPFNMFVLLDALNHGIIKGEDIDYTNSGIVKIKGARVNGKGHIKLIKDDEIDFSIY